MLGYQTISPRHDTAGTQHTGRLAFGTQVQTYRWCMTPQQIELPKQIGTTTAAWVPQSCSLPSVEQPLRIKEFDELFASALRGLVRPTPTRLRLILDREAETAARELAARESDCCSFFVFSFVANTVDDEISFEVGVPSEYIAVLDALAARAAARSAVGA